MFEMTKETIGAVYEALKVAVVNAFDAGEAAIAAKNSLEAMRLSMLMTGEIDGKNEAQREAKARQILEEKYGALEICEAEARRTRTALAGTGATAIDGTGRGGRGGRCGGLGLIYREDDDERFPGGCRHDWRCAGGGNTAGGWLAGRWCGDQDTGRSISEPALRQWADNYLG